VFIGHYAVGFAAKRAAPKASLGWLIGGAVFLDLLWPIFLLLGWERVRPIRGETPFLNLDFVAYPISHSLVTAVAWALLAGGVFWIWKRNRTVAFWIGVCVLSHWILDFVTHLPDLPLWPGGPKVGLGLWSLTSATIAVEVLMFAAGLWIYSKTTAPRDGVGLWGYVGFVAFTLAIYAASLAGPPPPNARAIAWTALSAWIMPVWAGWFDRHRQVRFEASSTA
jgi:hypothetical protein